MKSLLSLELMGKYGTRLTIKLNTTTYMLLERRKYWPRFCSILTFTTVKLLQMRNAALPDVDQLITMNIDALALLGHTKCELSMRRRDAIRPNLNKDYSSLCASHVATYLFGETQLNDIRASNKISKAAVPQRFDKARPYGHPHFHSTNNSSSKGKSRKNQLLSNSHAWKGHPPRSTFHPKKTSPFPGNRQQQQ